MNERQSTRNWVSEVETRRLTERGYTVYRGGAHLLLPEPLVGINPDAVAVGVDPNLVIEVVTGGAGDVEKLAHIRRAVGSAPGWQLRVLLDSGARSTALSAASIESIDTGIESAENAFKSGEPAPALLIGWGVFEALARRLLPDEFERPQTPGRLVQVLAPQGLVTVNEEPLLRRLAAARNALIHGDLSKTPSRDDTQAFIGILRSLRDQLAPAA